MPASTEIVKYAKVYQPGMRYRLKLLPMGRAMRIIGGNLHSAQVAARQHGITHKKQFDVYWYGDDVMIRRTK